MSFKNKPLHGLNGSNKTLQLWEIDRHMRRHSSVVGDAKPTKETTQHHNPFIMKRQTHAEALADQEIARQNEKLLRKIRDLHLDDTAETQPALVNPTDQRRVEEYNRILALKAQVRENSLKQRENEARNINERLRNNMQNTKSSYETARYNEEYHERAKRQDAISRSKRNTAESFVLGGTGALGMCSKSRSMSRLGKSCPDFSTNLVGTSGKIRCEDSDDRLDGSGEYAALEDELLSGHHQSAGVRGGAEAFGLMSGDVYANADNNMQRKNRPRSSPAVRRPKPSKEPRRIGTPVNPKGNKQSGSGMKPRSPEMLRSLTEERLKDIERIERVLRGLKDNDANEQGAQPLQLFASSAKFNSSSRLSDLSGDDPQESFPLPLHAASELDSPPQENKRPLSAAMLNPLMKMKTKASRIRKLNAYMSSLETELAGDEATAQAIGPSDALNISSTGNHLLPSSAVWTLKLKRQRIRKINKYLSDLQSSFGPGPSSSDDDFTKDEMEELERILCDIPDPATSAPVENADRSDGLGSRHISMSVGEVARRSAAARADCIFQADAVPIGHVKLGYGSHTADLNSPVDFFHKFDSADSDNSITNDEHADMKSSVPDMILPDKTYTEFGLPADVSMLPPHRDDDSFLMCGDNEAHGPNEMPRDIYRLGAPRCSVISECDVECELQPDYALWNGDRAILTAEMEALTKQAFSLRISDVGLAYSREMLNMKPRESGQSSGTASPVKRGVKYGSAPLDSDKVLTSTGLLIELLGPAHLETMIGESKRPPWDIHITNYQSHSEFNKKHTQRYYFSPAKKARSGHEGGKGSTKDDPTRASVKESPRVVISRHFLSIPQLHAISGSDFSTSLHKKLGKLCLFDRPSNGMGSSYCNVAINSFGSPGLLYECLSTYLDTMGKGLLLEMILSCFTPSISLVDASIHPPIGLGQVQYLNSNICHAAGIAIRNEIIMKENPLLRLGIFLSFPQQ